MKKLWLIASFIFAAGDMTAQDVGPGTSILMSIPDKLFGAVDKKTAAISSGLQKQTDKYLDKLSRSERKLRKRLARLDSVKANALFGDADSAYAGLKAQLRKHDPRSRLTDVYNGHLDSLATAFKFLDSQTLFGKAGKGSKQYQRTVANLSGLQDKLNATEKVKERLQRRQQYIQEQLANMPLGRQFRRYRQKIYYYKVQLEQYRQILEDPGKLEAQLLRVLAEVPAFREYFGRFSQFGSIFSLPGSPPAATAGSGMQTREMLTGEMQRLGGDFNVRQVLDQNGLGPGAIKDQVKNQLSKLGGDSGDEKMPDFKPNPQKTKRFLQRIETGVNIQNTTSNRYFPSTTDVALSAGYKINDKSVIGLGMSYRVGWGQSIEHIRVSHQGLGFRSFVDVRIKGGFWLTGGGEMNYRVGFSNLSILRNFKAWQTSALAGITKKYQINNKLKGNVQLLYDFLGNQQAPPVNPLNLRFGYSF